MPPSTEPPELETSRLLLRGHRPDDFPAFAAMWADPEVVRHISGRPSTAEESWHRFLRDAGHWRIMGYGYWVIEEKAGGAFLGEVGLADFRRDMTPALGDRPEAGWVLARAAHGRGIATEAIRRVLAWADADLPNPDTVCIIAPGHARSIRVAEKAGYIGQGEAAYRDQPILVMARPKAAAAGAEAELITRGAPAPPGGEAETCRSCPAADGRESPVCSGARFLDPGPWWQFQVDPTLRSPSGRSRSLISF
jgi:RimJ/RimL family protein N-acetyltransferase